MGTFQVVQCTVQSGSVEQQVMECGQILTQPTHGPDSQRFVPYHDAYTVKPAVLQVPCRTDSTAPERTAGEVRVTTLSRSFFPLSSLAPARRALAAAGNGAAGCRCRFRGHGHGHGNVQLTSSSCVYMPHVHLTAVNLCLHP